MFINDVRKPTETIWVKAVVVLQSQSRSMFYGCSLVNTPCELWYLSFTMLYLISSIPNQLTERKFESAFV